MALSLMKETSHLFMFFFLSPKLLNFIHLINYSNFGSTDCMQLLRCKLILVKGQSQRFDVNFKS